MPPLHGKQKSTELRIIDLVRPNPKKGHQYLTFLRSGGLGLGLHQTCG